MYKITAWDNAPVDTTEVLYARTKLGYLIKLLYTKILHDYIEVTIS